MTSLETVAARVSPKWALEEAIDLIESLICSATDGVVPTISINTSDDLRIMKMVLNDMSPPTKQEETRATIRHLIKEVRAMKQPYLQHHTEYYDRLCLTHAIDHLFQHRNDVFGLASFYSIHPGNEPPSFTLDEVKS